MRYTLYVHLLFTSMFQKPCDWEAAVSYTDNLLHWQKILLESLTCHWFRCNTCLLAFCTQLHSAFCLQDPKERILSNAPWKACICRHPSFIKFSAHQKWLAPCTPLDTIYSYPQAHFVPFCTICILFALYCSLSIPGPVVYTRISGRLYVSVFLLSCFQWSVSPSLIFLPSLKSVSQCPLMPIPWCLPEIHDKFYLATTSMPWWQWNTPSAVSWLAILYILHWCWKRCVMMIYSITLFCTKNNWRADQIRMDYPVHCTWQCWLMAIATCFTTNNVL